MLKHLPTSAVQWSKHQQLELSHEEHEEHEETTEASTLFVELVLCLR